MASVIADPADAQQVLYGTVSRDGVLIGSYYCTDQARQSGWRVVAANGEHVTYNGTAVSFADHGDALYLLTALIPGDDSDEVERHIRRLAVLNQATGFDEYHS
ncbi:hypothetical protein SK571_30790 [Lentzea sp. BCCO 10_0798]|uniref:Uncharacterized protein n=1 Tax=Lentzea kristufekii TaxID=3095430 RepID=A0ABU4TZN9_9PSEU|nr:hypothetical protein [Lentzea sp. BCCO 10_0798]MDX8053778.1 hypothetical protein [Lentzea sp. BCCO 10_0798]